MTEDKWDLYNDAVVDLEQAGDDYLKAIEQWLKAAITDKDNISDMKDHRQLVKEHVKDYVDQFDLDYKYKDKNVGG